MEFISNLKIALKKNIFKIYFTIFKFNFETILENIAIQSVGTPKGALFLE